MRNDIATVIPNMDIAQTAINVSSSIRSACVTTIFLSLGT